MFSSLLQSPAPPIVYSCHFINLCIWLRLEAIWVRPLGRELPLYPNRVLTILSRAIFTQYLFSRVPIPSLFLLVFLAPLMSASPLCEMTTPSQMPEKQERYLGAPLELLTCLPHPSKLQRHSDEIYEEIHQKREAKNNPDMHEDEDLMTPDVRVDCTFLWIKNNYHKDECHCPTSPCVVVGQEAFQKCTGPLLRIHLSETKDSFLHSMQHIKYMWHVGKHFISVWGNFGGRKSQGKGNKDVRMA